MDRRALTSGMDSPSQTAPVLEGSRVPRAGRAVSRPLPSGWDMSSWPQFREQLRERCMLGGHQPRLTGGFNHSPGCTQENPMDAHRNTAEGEAGLDVLSRHPWPGIQKLSGEEVHVTHSPQGPTGDSDVPSTPSHLKTFSWRPASSQHRHTVVFLLLTFILLDHNTHTDTRLDPRWAAWQIITVWTSMKPRLPSGD